MFKKDEDKPKEPTGTDDTTSESMKIDLPPVRTFKVRRYRKDPRHSIELVEDNLVDSAVEAHRIQFTSSGDVIFDRCIHISSQYGATFKTVNVLAQGTWYDVADITDEMTSKAVN